MISDYCIFSSAKLYHNIDDLNLQATLMKYAVQYADLLALGSRQL